MKRVANKMSFLVAVLFVLVAIQTRAQIPPTLQDSTLISDPIEEITVTAFRSPYNIFNTPAPINLILPEQLDNGIALTPVEALNQVPGVLMHHGTLNTNRLTIRGIGSRTPYGTSKIKAYFGEIPLTSGDGETTLEDLENSAIQRVEIIKGPSSSIYGAGLAGVILFHPKTVVKSFVQNRSSAGSFGTFKNTVSAGINAGKLKLFTLGSYLSSNGYRENNDTKRGNLFLNNTYNFSENTSLQVLLNATSMKAYIPSSLDLETYNNSPASAAANWNAVKGYEQYTTAQLGVSLNYFTASKGKVSVSLVGNIKRLDERRPFNFLDEASDYIAWRAEAQKILDFEKTRFVFTSGFEMFREKFDWHTSNNDSKALLSDNNEKRQYENLFVQIESRFNDKIFISTGLNGNLTRFYYTDYFTDDGDQSGKHSYKPVISPRFGLNALLTKHLSAFANVSHGFSTPSFEETLLPEGQINPDIKPETGWNFEIGFRSHANKRLQLSASYYRIYIENLLVARRTGEDAYIGINAGKSIHPGLELELNWNAIRLNNRSLLRCRANTTLSNFHFKDFVDEGNDYSGNLLPGTAKKTFLLSAYLHPTKTLSLHGWYRVTDKMPLNDANSGYSDSFGIANLELQYNRRNKRILLNVKGGIQNIFDEHYASMLAVNATSFNGEAPRYYYPGQPRNYFVSISIALLEKP